MYSPRPLGWGPSSLVPTAPSVSTLSVLSSVGLLCLPVTFQHTLDTFHTHVCIYAYVDNKGIDKVDHQYNTNCNQKKAAVAVSTPYVVHVRANYQVLRVPPRIPLYMYSSHVLRL